MNILLIITDYGSFNNFLAELAMELLHSGHRVSVICGRSKVIAFEDKYDFEALGIQFHFTNFPRSMNPIAQLMASIRIHQLIKKIKPDLVNIHFTTGIFTTVLWKRPSCSTLGTIHGLGYSTMPAGLKRLLFRIVENFCIRRVDETWVLNEQDYQILSPKIPSKIRKYHSFGVGCDLTKFDPTTFSSEHVVALKHRLSIPSSSFVIAYTGRFVEFKGFGLVVKSFFNLKRQGINVHLLLIGGIDPIHPTGLTDDELTQSHTDKDINYIGFTKEVAKYLAISDLFLFPSRKEGMPVCIMEAMAMGIPVITLNTRGCQDIVSQGVNGLVLAENVTPDSMANEIINLIRDPVKRKMLAKNARDSREMFSRKEYVTEQIKIYESYAN